MKFEKNEIGIKKQVVRLVLSCSIITLFIAGSISLYGMLKIKSTAVSVGTEIGTDALHKSSQILEEQKKAEMIGLATDRAKDIHHHLHDLSRTVRSVSLHMNTIFSERSIVVPKLDYQSISIPEESQPRRINFYIQHGENFNPADHSEEIALTAIIKDFLIQCAEYNPMIDTMIVASKNDFSLSADDDSDFDQDNFNLVSSIYDAVNTDWYQAAVNKNNLIFTEVRQFIFTKQLGLFCAVPYYDANNQIAGVACAQASLKSINSIVQDIERYKKEFCFVVDEKNRIILSTSNHFEFGEQSKFDFSDEKNFIEQKIDGKKYFIAYAPVEGMNWKFAIAISKSEIGAPIKQNAQIIENLTEENISELNQQIFIIMILMAISLFVLSFFAAYVGRILSDKLVKPINQLSEGVKEIANGNLDKKIELHTGNEIENLADCVNTMASEIKTYMENLTKVTAEKERIATELKVAENIQQSMLPHDFNFNRDDFEIFATMNAAKAVGGDFYDFYLLDENHLVITIADVSGKGIPAALFMANSKTILKNFAMSMKTPDDFAAVMTLSNQQLCQNNDEMMFVTVFMGMLDLQTGKFIFVNGGHNPPMIYNSKEKIFSYLKVKENCVLGLMDEIEFEQQEIQLKEGDIIYLYTDGVTEAMNEKKEQYSEKRLEICLNEIDCKCDLPQILESVSKSLKEHVGAAEQSDDITMFALRLNRLSK